MNGPGGSSGCWAARQGNDCHEREIARFAGREAQVLQGLRTARQQQYREDAYCRITSYESLVRDVDLVQAWAPELLIVDEAQRVKNWKTVAARVLKRIETPYAFVLTGTPLENRLVVLAMPISWKGTLAQYAGRLHREHDSKSSARIADFVDEGHPALLRMWERHQRGYQAMGYRVVPSASGLFDPDD